MVASLRRLLARAWGAMLTAPGSSKPLTKRSALSGLSLFLLGLCLASCMGQAGYQSQQQQRRNNEEKIPSAQ